VRDSLRSLARRIVRRAHGAPVPQVDPGLLDAAARRTRVVRLLLAAALVAAVAGAFVLAPRTPERRFLPADAAGVVVLDVSSSVKPETYFRIEQTLATIAASRSRLGFVLFSDVAYEAFPLGTPAVELKPLLRFFAPPSATPAPPPQGQELPRSPWEQWFSAGTKVSSGLFLAADMLARQHAKHGAVVLISDLADDPTDLQPLTQAVLLLERRQVPLEIVGLDPTAANADFFRNLLGTEAVYRTARLPTGAEARGKVELNGAFATGLAVVAVLAILLLTVNEWWAEPLRWRGSSA
jgi:hypothetical protein